MAQIKVTADILENKELEARGYAAQHGEALEIIKQIVYSLNEIWKGDAQDRFVQEFEAMQFTIDEFRRNLDGYLALMGQTATQFRLEDTTLANDMGGFI